MLTSHDAITKSTPYLVCLSNQLHKTTASIGFIKKALCNNVTPKFATIKGQFLQKADQIQAQRLLMCTHLKQHGIQCKSLIREYDVIATELTLYVGEAFAKLLIDNARYSTRKVRKASFQTKNKQERLAS